MTIDKIIGEDAILCVIFWYEYFIKHDKDNSGLWHFKSLLKGLFWKYNYVAELYSNISNLIICNRVLVFMYLSSS